jgi:hypothetical protein
MKAFLHFGGAATVDGADSPRMTHEVECKESPLPWQARGLQYTASGYSVKAPTPYLVKWAGRWRRVYSCCVSNAGSLYLGKPGAWLCTVDIERGA